MDDVSLSILVGKTLASIEIADDKETITLQTSDGETYQFYHYQDCCETVGVDDIAGDLGDLVGSPILRAEERSSDEDDNSAMRPDDGGYADSWTWTFYELATIKGSVTIRWLGSSNGYYSESVDFRRVA